MMIARLRNDPMPLRRMRSDLDIPEAVERVVNKGLQRNAEDRYQTTLEFAEAFSAAAGQRTQGASSDSGLFGKLFGR
jgi:hypothetical protein